MDAASDDEEQQQYAPLPPEVIMHTPAGPRAMQAAIDAALAYARRHSAAAAAPAELPRGGTDGGGSGGGTSSSSQTFYRIRKGGSCVVVSSDPATVGTTLVLGSCDGVAAAWIKNPANNSLVVGNTTTMCMASDDCSKVSTSLCTAGTSVSGFVYTEDSDQHIKARSTCGTGNMCLGSANNGGEGATVGLYTCGTAETNGFLVDQVIGEHPYADSPLTYIVATLIVLSVVYTVYSYFRTSDRREFRGMGASTRELQKFARM